MSITNMIKKSGFSLVEVLVFTALIGIFFVMAAAATTTAIRNMKYNEHKIMATHYARELEEWLRAKKENDWNDFTFHFSTGTFCFKDDPIPQGAGYWGSGACLSTDLINSLYLRSVTFSNVTVGGFIQQVNAQITVSWTDLNTNYLIKENTIFDVFGQ